MSHAHVNSQRWRDRQNKVKRLFPPFKKVSFSRNPGQVTSTFNQSIAVNYITVYRRTARLRLKSTEVADEFVYEQKGDQEV